MYELIDHVDGLQVWACAIPFAGEIELDVRLDYQVYCEEHTLTLAEARRLAKALNNAADRLEKENPRGLIGG